MLETLNSTESSEPRVSESPQVAANISATMKGQLGIQPSDIKESKALAAVASVAASMKEATSAIEANSEILSNVINKEQKAMFAGFLRELRNTARDGDKRFAENQDKFLARLAQLQASYMTQIALSPEDANQKVLLNAFEEMKKKLITPEKVGFKETVKKQLLTMPKAEHFKEGSFIREAFFGKKEQDGKYGKLFAEAQRNEKANTELSSLENKMGLTYDRERGRHKELKEGKKPLFEGKGFREAPLKNKAEATMTPKGMPLDKDVMERSTQALMTLGKHDKKSAQKAVQAAMEAGATTDQEVIKEAFNPGSFIKPNKPIGTAPSEPVKGTLHPVGKVKFNQTHEEGDSPYAEERPKFNQTHAEGDSPYLEEGDDSPYLSDPPKKGRGGLGGPASFEHTPSASISEKTDALTPEQETPKTTTGIQADPNKVQELLTDIKDGIADLTDVEKAKPESSGEGGGLIQTLKGLLPGAGKAAAGAGAVEGIGGAAAGAGGLAMAGTAIGGLAGGFAVGEGINKLMGQQTATQTIMEHGEASEMMGKVEKKDSENMAEREEMAHKRGYASFHDMHLANQQKAFLKGAGHTSTDLRAATDAAQAKPTELPVPPQVIVQQAAPVEQPPAIEQAMAGGVRPTDPVFLRFQDKRWTRSA